MKNLNAYISEKLVIDKDVQKIAKVSGIAEKIVSAYFGGYIPATLSEEGMKCNSDEEIYKLAEKMEMFYMSKDNSEDPELPEDNEKTHKEVIEWIKKSNR